QPHSGHDGRPALVVVAKPDRTSLSGIRRDIEQGGGRVVHMFPPASFIAELSPALFEFFRRDPRVSLIADSAVDAGAVELRIRIAANAWNAILRHRDAMARDLYADPACHLPGMPDDLRAAEQAIALHSSRPTLSDALVPPAPAPGSRLKPP